MKNRSHFLGLALFAALAAAPGTAEAQTPYAHLEGSRSAEEVEETTRVQVRNQNFLDVNVYVWNGGQRIRLGSVTGLATRTLTLPKHLVFGMSDLAFELDPVGRRGRSYTNEVSVLQGDTVILTVPPTGL